MKKLLTILFAVALGLSLSAQTNYADDWNPDADGDNSVGVSDLLALLSVFAENDEDDDGIWDSQDDCVGAYDECDVCNGPGPTVAVIESITILYDSLYAEQIDEWWVYESGADTVFNYFCVTQLDDTNIHEAVDLWLSDEAEALTLYGPISAWDVSDVTNMSNLFQSASSFNGDISSWDVSNILLMNHMFNGASIFNGDLSSWDVSSVTNMGAMFSGAGSFNGDLSSWDVSSVTNMSWMFYSANSFNGDLSSWDVSSVTVMNVMFYFAHSFNGDLSSWDVSSVTNMNGMFTVAQSFNGDLSSWDVSGVTNMGWMFYGASVFNGEISSWDVSGVTVLNLMFKEAAIFNGDLSSWDVSSVTNMEQMFFDASSFNRDISSWDVSSVTEMTEMFDNTGLSEENKCVIHTSFSTNANWPYEWAEFCLSAGFNTCGDDIGYDGYNYETVQIGDQCWFAENLRNEHYANGDAIPGELSASEWGSTTQGAMTIYGEGTSTVSNGSSNEVANLADYGRLYNWYAVDDSRGLCPSDWHVPSDGEYITLTNGLGGEPVAGEKLKSSLEDSPSWDGTNSSGFSGLAGGNRDEYGSFYSGGENGYFWSASAAGTNAWNRKLNAGDAEVNRFNDDQRYGFSVRCIKDTEE